MQDTRTILVVTNDDGTILGASFPAAPDDHGNSTGIEALPGQTVHRVALPETLWRLQSSEDIVRAVFDYYLPPGANSLERSDRNPRGQISLSTD